MKGKNMYTIEPDKNNPDYVLVTSPDGVVRRIHREDADPEHRYLSYRLAAGWFDNFTLSKIDLWN